MAAISLSGRRVCGRFALGVLVGILALELFNSARMLATPVPNRHFPDQYVTKGIWSPYGLIRPPHPKGADAIEPLRASHQFLHRDPNLYDAFTRSRWNLFPYPPSAAVLLLPFAWIADGGSERLASQCFDLTCRLAFICMAWATLNLLRGVLQHRTDWLLGLLVIAAFFPIRWAICCVNAQVIINLALVGVILAYASSRRVLCGILLGLVCSIKPCLAVVLLFILARKEWKTGLTAMTTAGAVVSISLLVVGIQPWKTFVYDVLPVLSAGYAAHGNQSLLGALRRWHGDLPVADLIPPSPGLRIAIWSASAILIALAVLPRAFRPRPSPPKTSSDISSEFHPASSAPERLYRISDISIAAFATMLASPIAWDHYYGWAVVTFAMCLCAVLHKRLSPRLLVLTGVCYALMGTDWVPVSPGRPGFSSLLDSPKIFAAMILSAVLWQMCRRLAAESQSTQQAGSVGIVGGS